MADLSSWVIWSITVIMVILILFQLASDLALNTISPRRWIGLVALLVLPISSEDSVTHSASLAWIILARVLMTIGIYRLWLPLHIPLRQPFAACLGSRCRRYGHVTQRMYLQPIGMRHLQELYELNSDPVVMRWITAKPPSRTEISKTIRNRLGYRWCAYDRHTGAFIGWFGMRPMPRDEIGKLSYVPSPSSTSSSSAAAAPITEYELGYRLRRRYWKKGLATEGARCVISHAFTELGATRVWAHTMTTNKESRGVIHRCGFTYVRTFFGEYDEVIEGSEHGDVEYEMTRDQWRKINSNGSANSSSSTSNDSKQS